MTIIVQKLDNSFSMPDRLKIGGAGGRKAGKRRDRHMKNVTDTHTEFIPIQNVISSNELCDLKNSHLLIKSLKEF